MPRAYTAVRNSLDALHSAALGMGSVRHAKLKPGSAPYRAARMQLDRVIDEYFRTVMDVKSGKLK